MFCCDGLSNRIYRMFRMRCPSLSLSRAFTLIFVGRQFLDKQHTLYFVTNRGRVVRVLSMLGLDQQKS